MQDFTKRTIIEYIFVAIVFVGTLVFLFIMPTPKGHVYDCSISEISPDYPIEVKEQCRKVRTENFKENLQKPK